MPEDWDDSSPLHTAASIGNERILSIVLESPVMPLLVATKGVLFYGRQTNSTSIMDRLWWRDQEGRTALMTAVDSNQLIAFRKN